MSTNEPPAYPDGTPPPPPTPPRRNRLTLVMAVGAGLLLAGAAVAVPLVLDDDTVSAVAEVCRSLDGLPLAIELAASRVRSLSVRDIARRLDDRFVLLRDPTSQQQERRRALAGAIAWSYELLFPDDQRGLWALSCFAGSASLDATEHVLTALGVPVDSVLDTMSRLVDRSLVSVENVEGGAGDVAAIECCQQGPLVHDAATGRVDHK